MLHIQVVMGLISKVYFGECCEAVNQSESCKCCFTYKLYQLLSFHLFLFTMERV